MVAQPQAIGEEDSAVGKRSAALAAGQLVKTVVFAVVFWFVAALSVRFGSAAGFFGPTASMIVFALSIPISWLSVGLIKKVARLEAGQTVASVVVATVVATLCDGLALTWGRGLYGSDPAQITFGAAWILWGVGLILLFAYLDDQRQASATRY